MLDVRNLLTILESVGGLEDNEKPDDYEVLDGRYDVLGSCQCLPTCPKMDIPRGGGLQALVCLVTDNNEQTGHKFFFATILSLSFVGNNVVKLYKFQGEMSTEATDSSYFSSLPEPGALGSISTVVTLSFAEFRPLAQP